MTSDTTHFRTCPLCEAMCGIVIEHRDGAVLSVRPDREDVLSRGHICPKAVALKEAMTSEYQTYATQVIRNAQALSASLAEEGMRPVSGGTDTHLALFDVRGVGVTGAEAEARCDAARITLNKNAIPYDPQPPSVASGIRVGTRLRRVAGQRLGTRARIPPMPRRRGGGHLSGDPPGACHSREVGCDGGGA